MLCSCDVITLKNKCVWMQVRGSNCPDMIIVNCAIVAEMHNCSLVTTIRQ